MSKSWHKYLSKRYRMRYRISVDYSVGSPDYKLVLTDCSNCVFYIGQKLAHQFKDNPHIVPHLIPDLAMKHVFENYGHLMEILSRTWILVMMIWMLNLW